MLRELATCGDCRELFRDCLIVSSGGRDRAVDALPDELAGYQLGEILGAGGNGVVVKAHDPVLARDVALKLVRTDTALAEARTLATVRHPAVVQVYAAGTIDRLGYVAMELVEGTSLAARIPVAWPTAVSWFAEVCHGLAAIHAAGLVHRDVKPANLLVDHDRLRIADFGLAARTPEATVAGTLPYLAPEVLAGQAADVRSDIYGLFVSLFESINGERPYREHDRRALRAAAEHGHPIWTARVPARVKRVIERGFAGDPALRYRDAAEARAALASLGSRRRWPFAIVGAAAALGVALWHTNGERCSLPAPAWSDVPPALRAPLASYGDALLARACADPSTRACIANLDARVTALLASHGREVDLQRAILDLPDPSSCTGTSSSAFEAANLARARALLASGQPAEALTQIAAFGSSDAELVRAQSELALGHDAAAIAAYRHVLETGARDAVAVAANNGLAAVIGIRQHEAAAGEAYATTARQLAQTLGDRRGAAIALTTIGTLASQRGDAPRAITLLTSAIGELADSPLQRSAAELALAGVQRTKGDYAAARAHVETAFALRRDVLGKDHPDTIAIDLDRANIDSVDGRAPHAVELMRGMIARLESLYGPTAPELATPLTSLGRALAGAGDYPAAEAALSRALEIQRAAHGELSREAGQAYANLAQVRSVHGTPDETVALYRSGLAATRSVTGDGHPDLAPIYYGLGVALATGGHYADADATQAHAIEIWRAHPGHDHELAKALSARALIELGLQRVDDARRDASDALAILVQVHGPDHPALLPALSAVAQSELAAKNYAPARDAIERAIAIHRRIHASPRQLVEEQYVLAQILRAQKRREEAIAVAKQALADLGDGDRALATQIDRWIGSRN